MSTYLCKSTPLTGPYALEILASIDTGATRRIECGVVRFGRGSRSPATGMHVNSRHEVAYVLTGRVLIETQEVRFEAGPGDCIVGSPGDPHSTTALEDAELFFVLIEPTRMVDA